MNQPTPRFGVNLNNREPLLAPGYSLADLLALAEAVEAAGFDSVWVGDSLFSKPRYDPLILLAAISQRTRRVKLGTACLVTATRNPLYLASAWATLDHLAGGRTILGACMGNVEAGVRREYAALNLDFRQRASIFEEGLAVLRQLWREGRVTFQGEHFRYDDISFYSGVETAPFGPLQAPPPMWIVSNPRMMVGRGAEKRVQKVIGRAARRIAAYGDGWLTCCRAQHPDEFREQRAQIIAAIEAAGRNPAGFTTAYQVTLHIADRRQAAQRGLQHYIDQYYPEFGPDIDLEEWGPVGTPGDIIAWLRTFAGAGVDHFICRFGALNQLEQMDRFAREVLPAFAG
ncbi:MAG: LLM class flavin-dependent oxidoreductase [Anaerolineae bacterium]